MAIPDRFDIVRERLPPDLGEVVAGAMARAGYRPTREAPDAAGPYRRPADGPLCASFEPDPAARPRTTGQVQVRQEDERTLRVEIAFPPFRLRWRAAAWGVNAYAVYFAMFVAIHQLHWPRWLELSVLAPPVLVATAWLRARTNTWAQSQVYHLVLDSLALALDDANRVRIAVANAEAASLPEGEDAVEADAGEGGAARAERHG